MYFIRTYIGEVSVAEIFAQLEREYHAAHAKATSAASGKGGAAAKGRAGAAAGAATATAGALPVRLDLMSLKRLLEYLRLSESGAVIKVCAVCILYIRLLCVLYKVL